MQALDLYDRSDELGDALDEWAHELCDSYEEKLVDGARVVIYLFADGSELTLSETGYLGATCPPAQ